jgi:predicted nucleic acid-binding protein
VKVVDASVVLGWILREPEAASGSLLDDHIAGRKPLVAPELLHYEVANVLVRGARLTPADALEGYEHFAALEIETYSLGHTEYAGAVSLAAAHRLTVYDASYAALAQALRCPFVTADRRLARALHGTGLVEAV